MVDLRFGGSKGDSTFTYLCFLKNVPFVLMAFNCKDAFGHNHIKCNFKCVRFQTFMTCFMICVSIRSDRDFADL